MIERWKSFAALVVLVAAMCVVAAGPVAVRRAPVPVLVELFTSEGCSSCPPADRLLGTLLRQQPVRDAQIIGIGEHVTYFNGRGWTDRFSQRLFVRRQYEYEIVWGVGSPYTPQMVIDGGPGFVGSNAAKAMDLIAEAARAPKRPVVVECAERQPGTAELKIEVPAMAQAHGRFDVFAAFVEDNLTSQVAGGENRGAHMIHAAVARSLTLVGNATSVRGFTSRVRLPLAPGWKREDLRAVVFAQDPQSRRVLGAATAPVR